MPREKKSIKGPEPDFEEEFKRIRKQENFLKLTDAFMLWFAQVCDESISEDGVWFNVGRRQDGSAVQLTLHEGRVVSFAAGLTFAELLEASIRL